MGVGWRVKEENERLARVMIGRIDKSSLPLCYQIIQMHYCAAAFECSAQLIVDFTNYFLSVFSFTKFWYNFFFHLIIFLLLTLSVNVKRKNYGAKVERRKRQQIAPEINKKEKSRENKKLKTVM